MHIVLGWNCKTKDCSKFHAAKYLGVKEELEASSAAIPIKPPGQAVIFPCPSCRQTHKYGMKEILSIELDTPPPSGFRDMF